MMWTQTDEVEETEDLPRAQQVGGRQLRCSQLQSPPSPEMTETADLAEQREVDPHRCRRRPPRHDFRRQADRLPCSKQGFVSQTILLHGTTRRKCWEKRECIRQV